MATAREGTGGGGGGDSESDGDKIQQERDTEKRKPKVIMMEDHITYILHETLLGLKYIHENGQIHRDIKAGNILLDSLGNGKFNSNFCSIR